MIQKLIGGCTHVLLRHQALEVSAHGADETVIVLHLLEILLWDEAISVPEPVTVDTLAKVHGPLPSVFAVVAEIADELELILGLLLGLLHDLSRLARVSTFRRVAIGGGTKGQLQSHALAVGGLIPPRRVLPIRPSTQPLQVLLGIGVEENALAGAFGVDLRAACAHGVGHWQIHPLQHIKLDHLPF